MHSNCSFVYYDTSKTPEKSKTRYQVASQKLASSVDISDTHRFCQDSPRQFQYSPNLLKQGTTNKEKVWSRLGKFLLAGFISGAVTSVALTPVEVVTSLKSKANSPYSSLALHTIGLRIVEERGWKGLFDGWTGFVLRSAVTKSLRLALFEHVKYFLQTHRHPSRDIVPLERLVAASVTGMIAMAVCYPLHATQTLRMKGIVPPRSVRSVYGGWLPAVLRMVPQYGLEYFFYDILRTEVSKRRSRSSIGGSNVDLNIAGVLVLSAVSSLFAQTLAQPFNVVSKRMVVLAATDSTNVKVPSQVATMLSVASEIWKESGIKGFFKGLRYRYLKAIPSIFVSKMAMQRLNQILGLMPVPKEQQQYYDRREYVSGLTRRSFPYDLSGVGQ
eukprot:jgi/Galph1/2505/GphlegSOOS_G1171.1